MAKLFYGVSTSSGDSDKNVIIFNPLEETLMPGDLLAVYFAHGNTKPAPRLTIGDISLSSGEEESTSQSSDHGDTIKTHDVTAEVDYMWQSGEVCLFVLTSQQFNTDVNQDYEAISEEAGNNALHYMLIRGPRANSEYYGLTKLFTDSFPVSGNTFQQWLDDETDATNENDKTTAATPYLIKQLYNYLIGKLTPEPEPEPGPEPTPTPTPTPLPFKYESNVEEGYVVGTLTLGNGTFEVKIPVSESYEVERTSQLVNDADIVNVDGANVHNRGNSPQVGGYFITNVVDNGNLYLYKPDNNSVGLYVSIPAASGQSPDINTPVEGDLKVLPILARESGSPGATSLNKGFLDSPLKLYGQNINLYSNGSSDPTFIVKSTIVESSNTIKAPNFNEGGTLLENKYSKKLVIKKFRIGQGKTDASDGGSFSYHDGEKWVSGRGSTSIQIGKDNVTTGHMKVYVNSGLSGYTPLSIAGWNVSKTSGSGYTPAGADSNAREVSLWELYLTNRATGSMVVHYDARNLIQGTKICFVLDIDVLCVKS